jgi:hypothetical protein
MMKKLFKIIVFLGFISHNLYASEQFPDLLIYNGQQYEIGVFPMESYYENYPNRRPGSIGKNTALVRGYRAKYEIINNELFLIDIEIMRNGNWKSVFNRYFRNIIRVNMYTGKINLFNGEMTWVFIGFTPIYENYIIIDVIEGNINNIYNNSCYEYLESLIQSYPIGSHEREYFIEKLSELNKRKEQ